ncbi:hypothetical protein B0H19DRAFT_1070967 [Mycena capillaripes]|nr:hypothetical protein B0H19DRAFT_1070967 [Mycena capillaripes]
MPAIPASLCFSSSVVPLPGLAKGHWIWAGVRLLSDDANTCRRADTLPWVSRVPTRCDDIGFLVCYPGVRAEKIWRLEERGGDEEKGGLGGIPAGLRVASGVVPLPVRNSPTPKITSGKLHV